MGYLHIENLYKNQTILMFKECYALEKIHGTSAHIKWDCQNKQIHFFSGGESHVNFINVFNVSELIEELKTKFIIYDVCIFGEAYGGKQQGMSKTYGTKLKFVAFDVKIGDHWLDVPKAEDVCKSLNIEFVDYVKCSTDVEALNFERDKPSTQAIRNGCGNDKKREGVVIRPLIELRTNNGDRLISKHKGDDFKETKTPREVNPEQLIILENAKQIADEWVTQMRLMHVLDKLPKDINVESTLIVINAMLEDIYREAKGEIVESKESSTAINKATAKLFHQYIKSKLQTETK